MSHPARRSTPALPQRRAALPSLGALAMAALATGCAGSASRAANATLPAPAIAADSASAEAVAPGVVHRSYRIAAGPWMLHTLDVDRRQCWAPVAAKARAGAAGRTTTSATLSSIVPGGAIAAVNADFFAFAPAGVPQTAHVTQGRVIAGPTMRPVVALDSAHRLHVTTLRAAGWIVAGGDSLRVTQWNRLVPRGVAVVDFAYSGSGERVDSARAGVIVTLAREGRAHRVLRVDTAATGAALPDPLAPEHDGDWLLVVGRDAPPAARARAIALGRFVTPESPTAGITPTVDVRVRLEPFHPLTAVGGFGVLLRDGEIPASLDSTGAESFRGRHPRTAVGWSADQRRLVLAVVDGRQPGYSAGMTLRELAATMRDLGASEALNLDGGGSSAMAIAVREAGGATSVRVVNRPSDKEGERPVANVLAVTRGCAR